MSEITNEEKKTAPAEVSEETLEQVAGGVVPYYTVCKVCGKKRYNVLTGRCDSCGATGLAGASAHPNRNP